MDSNREFPNLCAAARELGSLTDSPTLDDLRKLLCYDCDFFTEDHEDDLECSCFQILRIILKRGILSPAELAEAVKPRDTESDEEQQGDDDSRSPGDSSGGMK